MSSKELDNGHEAVPVITIDGPGGSGKGTVAMRLAQDLGWHFLDSGVLYRIVAVAALDRDIGPDDEQLLGKLAEQLDVNFGFLGDGIVILLDGNRISGRMRSLYIINRSNIFTNIMQKNESSYSINHG